MNLELATLTGKWDEPEQPTPADLAAWACMLELCSPKPGNVHLQAAFEDVDWTDFAVSATLLAPLLDHVAARGVGETIYQAVSETRRVVGSNTNLGIILLLVPLAAVPADMTLREGIDAVLGRLDREDARAVYAAIQLAAPGGLGHADQADVREEPTMALIEAMRLGADRDAVAAEYASGFARVLGVLAPRLAELYRAGTALDEAVVTVQIEQLADAGDTLVARKCGAAVAADVVQHARVARDAGGTATPEGRTAIDTLDHFLRADGNRRNPGTTADLLCAALYAAFRDEGVRPPWRVAGSWLAPDDASE